MAVLILPVFLLIIAELALRLAGWGYPAAFFIRSGTKEPGLFTDNQKFGWRFFPPYLARAPDPIRLSKVKPPGTCRIFIFGESAALGDPEPAYAFSRILRELLEQRFPGTKFEVVNVAMTAINSHAALQIARDCVPFHADLWIIYMGNNEVIGPFGPSSVFGMKVPRLSVIRASLAVKCTRLGQLLAAIWQRAAAPAAQPRRWEGMKMMLHGQVRATDPALEGVYNHFERNLDDILSLANRAGVKPIVCSIPSNLKDCAPFASLHKPGLAEPDQAEWSRLLAAGSELESRRDFSQALALYSRAARIDETYAELAFRMARCDLALGEVAAAREQFTRARDLDVLRFRADSVINSIIRRVCARRASDGVQFVDCKSALTNGCVMGIPGAESFWDHVHLNFSGNYRLANCLAEGIVSRPPDHLHASKKSGLQLLTERDCADRLAYTGWDQRLVCERMWRRFHEAPFTTQVDHDKAIQQLAELRANLDRTADGQALTPAISIYKKALERRSEDWYLHHRFGYLLEAAGDFSEAERHWERVVGIVPEYADAWFKVGDMSARQSRLDQAEAAYNRVLQLRPDSFEALNGLGLVRMSQQRLDEAARFFERALDINLSFAQAHVNRGLVYSQSGQIANAEQQYREALRCDPESAGAHVNLGNLLAAQQRSADAIEQYRQAIHLQPNQATVHLGLGNCLEATGRGSEALAQFQEAIRLDPTLAEAHFNLAVARAKRGDLAGATRGFQEAARLNPNDPQAHLSLGVALAQQHQFREAMAEFQAVLRLQPGNATAQDFLQRATTMQHDSSR